MTTKGHHRHLLRARSAHSEMGPFFLHRSRWTWLRKAGFPFPTQQASRLSFFPERCTSVSLWSVWGAGWCRTPAGGFPLAVGSFSSGTWCVFWENSSEGCGGDPEGVVVHYCIFPDLNCSPEMDAFRLLHVEIIQNSLRCWVLQCHCRNGATDGHILATCVHNAFPRAYSVRIPVSCLIILEAVGSTFSRLFWGRTLIRQFIINISYNILFSLHQLYLIGWYYYWKVEPLMSKFNTEISFILWDLDTLEYKMEILTGTEAKTPFVGLGMISVFGGWWYSEDRYHYTCKSILKWPFL